MKKINLFLMVLIALILVGCKPDEDPNGDDDGNDDIVEVDINDYQGFLLKDNVYITTIGQADLPNVENILKMAGLVVEVQGDENAAEADVISNNILGASDVEKDALVILVIGASGKGLGAAGTDVEGELERADAFIARKEAGEIELVVIHIGGAGRTGQQSDPIINKTIPKAIFSLVLNSNNSEEFIKIFKTAAKDKSDLFEFTSVVDLMEALNVLVKED